MNARRTSSTYFLKLHFLEHEHLENRLKAHPARYAALGHYKFMLISNSVVRDFMKLSRK